jgi:hypothetical protein
MGHSQTCRMPRDVSADIGSLCDKTSVLGDMVKGTLTDLSNTVHSKLNSELCVRHVKT